MCHMAKCVAQMIQPEQVFLHAEPVDMRWSMDRLSLLIQQIDGRSPCDGTAYGFTNRNYSSAPFVANPQGKVGFSTSKVGHISSEEFNICPTDTNTFNLNE